MVKIEVYHHLGAKELKAFLQNTQTLSDINARLKSIQETLKIMGQNQDQIKNTLEEVQAEQAASAQRWEVRNAAQQKTIDDLKKLVDDLTTKYQNADAELSDELELAKQILQTEQQTFADVQSAPDESGAASA